MRKALLSGVMGLVVAIYPSAFALAGDSPPAIPAGSALHVRLSTTLSTRTIQNGDPFTGQVTEPIINSGQEVVPAGSTVEGRVSFVKAPGRAKGVAEMRLTPETITTPKGIQFSISAGLEDAQGAEGAKVKGEEGTVKGPGKNKKGGAIETGVGAGVGAGAGAIAD
jgi:hypothetical protein